LELEPLRFDKNQITIDEQCLDRFSKIIEKYKVCGVVVSWPLQHDTGRMGAACGRTIFALEQLWEQSNGGSNDVLSRPFCLWDSGHVVPKQRKDPAKRVDAFGRCASYGHDKEEVESLSSTKDDYFASIERYHEDELAVVCGVWNDFCKEHWPELYADSFSEPRELNSKAGKSNHDKEQDRKLSGDDTASSSASMSYGT
jgi:hypothetical protein